MSTSIVPTWSLSSETYVFDSTPSSDDAWLVNDSGFDNYCRCARIRPKRGGLRAIIESTIGYDPANIGVDLAGGENGQALQDLLELGIIGKALLTTYEDRRSPETADNTLIDHIAGNLVLPDTWKRIIAWRKSHAPDGLALVMHRPVGALQNLPPSAYIGMANIVLDNIRPGGVFFTQVPLALYGPSWRGACEAVRQRTDLASITLGKYEPLIYAAITKDTDPHRSARPTNSKPNLN